MRYVDQYLHRRYARPGKIECLAVHDKTVLDMLKKGKHTGSGLTFHEPVRVSNPQGLSATPARERSVLHMRFFRDMTLQEIGAE